MDTGDLLALNLALWCNGESHDPVLAVAGEDLKSRRGPWTQPGGVTRLRDQHGSSCSHVCSFYSFCDASFFLLHNTGLSKAVPKGLMPFCCLPTSFNSRFYHFLLHVIKMSIILKNIFIFIF